MVSNRSFILFSVINGLCSADEAADLYDWYTQPIPAARERIEQARSEGEYLADVRAEWEAEAQAEYLREAAEDSIWWESDCQHCDIPNVACTCN